ncbi:unnamed protein product, partial [Meganyctiphanes norvegica]
MLQDDEYDSDTSDEDFVPVGAAESDDEPLSGVEDENEESGGEDGDNKKTKKKGSRKKKKNDTKKQNPLLAQLGEEEDKNFELESKPKTEEKEKEKANSLWAVVVAETVEGSVTPAKTTIEPHCTIEVNLSTRFTGQSTGCREIDNTKQFDAFKKDSKKNNSETPISNTVKITQVFEFAGEEVRVEKEVDADSKEAKVAELKSQGVGSDSKCPSDGTGSNKRPAGLSSIMGLLESKKQKLSVLDKTKLDWNSFKSNLGIEEELESHKKSKDGSEQGSKYLKRTHTAQFAADRRGTSGKKSSR